MDDQKKIAELHRKLDALLERQDQFQVEINRLKADIYQLVAGQSTIDKKDTFQQDELLMDKHLQQETLQPVQQEEQTLPAKSPKSSAAPKPRSGPPKREPAIWRNFTKDFTDNLAIEQFVGRNLINKIGILILIIGVGIGGRYAIENQLVSPLTRIIFGYIMGLILLVAALRLKNEYNNFSAVLLSGAMAILYIITFLAYSFYSLMPQLVAFGLMVLFTIFTVLAALNYNRQVIAIIGLVGAYAVPFLLSSDSGDVGTLFSYITIINIGILFISFRKYWKVLYYLAFVITWLIFSGFIFETYRQDQHLMIGFTFCFLFFIIFYLTFLGYKLLKGEALNRGDIALMIGNSFLFYGFGYFMFSNVSYTQDYLGVYTLLNALIHFLVATIIYRTELANKSLFYLAAGMVLIFLTIAIPVQLDGNWVTLLWIGEAIVLLWIGRSQGAPLYANWSYILLVVAIGSLVQDWQQFYNTDYFFEADLLGIQPFWNIQFASSLLFSLGFAGFLYLQNKPSQIIKSEVSYAEKFKDVGLFLPIFFLVILYFSFYLEIVDYWQQKYYLTAIPKETAGKYMNADLLTFKSLWLVNYSMVFIIAFNFVYHQWFKKPDYRLFVLGLSIFGLCLFLLTGLYELSELRESFLNQTAEDPFLKTSYQVHIRYLSYLLVSVLLYQIYRSIQGSFPVMVWDILLAVTLLWIGTAELIHVRALMTTYPNYKVGLSIFWGVYSLLLVIIGIWKNKQHLRIAAMVLFGFTLLKLFAYDLSDMTTIAKTIVLVSLGLLLLIISFIYNKYQLNNEEEA